MNKIGQWIALAAIAVTGPRLVLIFLQADGIDVWPWAETFILAVTGIGTGLVLTGGGMYIAHKLAGETIGWPARLFLAVCWLLLLAFSVGLIAPALVYALQKSQLQAVLPSPYNWYWSIVAVVAVEILAGAAMVAQATTGQSQPQAATNKAGNLSILADALTSRLATEIAGQPPKPATSQPARAEQTSQPAERPAQPKPAKRKHSQLSSREATKQRRVSALIQFLANNPQATDQQMADAIGAAKATAQNYRDELLQAGTIHRNGHGWEVTA